MSVLWNVIDSLSRSKYIIGIGRSKASGYTFVSPVSIPETEPYLYRPRLGSGQHAGSPAKRWTPSRRFTDARNLSGTWYA